ncbi:MAG: hypothetical protein K8T89_16070, partial [Planctomycetes bacterium]|nr:hypothetical protein [Planctomycetota bacterium]
DMDLFVHDKRVQLIATGTPGPILVPPPPYWFGAKGRIVSPPLPRETPAKLVIPADVPPGPIYWQAANANGGTSTGIFIVSADQEVVEDERRKVPQLLPTLPVTVSGRLQKIEDVDRYRFVAPKDGPITCDLMARRLGSKFLGVIEVRDTTGKLVADAVGANGADPSLTFTAKASTEYVISILDIDFGGDRAYTYRLTVAPGPRVIGAIPAAGKRGETREVEFVGFGVATGAPKLESVKKQVAFPANPAATTFDYRLETPFGTALPFQLLLSDLPETVGSKKTDKLTLPIGITSVLDVPEAEDRYTCDWKKGEVWSLALQARRISSPLDVALKIIGPDGKEIPGNDDLPETTDAGLEFTVPADGLYQVVVSDTAGKSGTRSAIYRLQIQPAKPDFTLQLPLQRVGVPVGERANMTVQVVRRGGFKGPILIKLNGLPDGVNVHPALAIPAEKTDLVIALHADRRSGTAAGFITVDGTSGGLTRTATTRAAGNLSPRYPDENKTSSVFLATTLKPLFKGRPVDQDTGRKVHRGTTFPADVIIEREGFPGEIILQMAATQSYQMQGITGGDVIVPPGIERAIYPCFMPEWLETSRTSRMGMIAIAKVQDPQGRPRWMANEIKGFITMTMEGALMKLSAEEHEVPLPAGQPFDVQLKLARSESITEPVKLELRLPDDLVGKLKADPVTLAVGQGTASFRITPTADLVGQHTFTIRATIMQGGKYPMISEAKVVVELRAGVGGPK